MLVLAFLRRVSVVLVVSVLDRRVNPVTLAAEPASEATTAAVAVARNAERRRSGSGAIVTGRCER